MTARTETADLVRAERLALIELLESLSDADWAQPSLCRGWTVQDVAAHLAWATAMSPLAMVSGLARARFHLNRFVHDSARAWSGRGRDAILARLQRNAEDDAKPLGMPPGAVVTDAVVHQLDVRQPLRRRRPVPEAAFRVTADFLTGSGATPPASILLGGTVRRRTAGLRLVATDLDWSHGSGHDVRAGRDAILLVLSGRPVEPGELDGPGAAELTTRL